jgi:hypothetical protein
MQTPERRGLGQSGRSIVVWTTEHRGKRYRYVQTSDGRLISFGQYLNGMLEQEGQRLQQRQRHTQNRMMKRWARAWKAHQRLNTHSGNGTT